eukprot:Partr_v1_DN23129_c0_g1_i1_m43907 putative 60S ribosomal protein L13
MKHNNVLPNQHFRKDWQRRVKTWFNQPGKKESRRIARSKKAALMAPRPIDGPLRPAVRCPTIKYNTKMRAGRGFSLDELKAAGIPKKLARTIGISVDHRRRNKSVEGMQVNVERLKAYRARLIIFPKKASAPKKGDATDVSSAVQLGKGQLLPIARQAPVEAPRAITKAEKEATVYKTIRDAYVDARMVGVRASRAAAKAEEEEASKK